MEAVLGVEAPARGAALQRRGADARARPTSSPPTSALAGAPGVRFVGNVEGFGVDRGRGRRDRHRRLHRQRRAEGHGGRSAALLGAVRDRRRVESRAPRRGGAAAAAGAARAARRARPRGARAAPTCSGCAGWSSSPTGASRARGFARRSRWPPAGCARASSGAPHEALEAAGALRGPRPTSPLACPTEHDPRRGLRADPRPPGRRAGARPRPRRARRTRFKDDLEADSLDLYTLVQELEDSYGVKMSDEEAARILTVGAGRGLRARPPARRPRAEALTAARALRAAGRTCRRTSPGRRSRTPPGRERRADSYERLAFLGDSVLALAVTAHLYPRLEARRFGAGRLTKIRAQAVSGRSCRDGGRAAGDPGAPARGGAGRARRPRALTRTERVLASVIEAVIGACYLDFGFETTADAVVGGVRAGDRARRWRSRRTSSRRCRSGWRGAGRSWPTRSSRRRARRTTGPSRSSAIVEARRSGAARGRTQEGRRAGGRAGGAGGAGSRPDADSRRTRCTSRSLTLKGFKSFPDRTRLEFCAGRDRDRRAQRLGQVQHHRRGAVGAGRAVAARRARPVDAGRDLRRRPRRPGARARPRSRSCSTTPTAASTSPFSRDLDRRAGWTAPGEGEYRINGARCRLIDVIEVLSDTGLGKEMHSVVSQGRVEAIVTSKPRDRRLLIEEAAGLGKHRKRRRRAQLKLERTQDNLDRALDVEREARTRLRPLKRQAEAAELHERLERQTTRRAGSSPATRPRDRARRAGRGRGGGRRRPRAPRRGRARAGRRRRPPRGGRGGAGRARRRARGAGRALLRRALGRRAGRRCALEAARAAPSGLQPSGRAPRRRARRAGGRGGRRQPTTTAPQERIAALERRARAARPSDRARRLERELAELERERRGGRRPSSSAPSAAARGAAGAPPRAADEARRGRARPRAARPRRPPRRRAPRGRPRRRRAGRASTSSCARTPARRAARARWPTRCASSPGYELALAAALGAAACAPPSPPTWPGGGALLGRARARRRRRAGRRAPARRPRPAAARAPGAERAARPRAAARRARPALAAALLADVWVVESLDGLPDDFTGIAVTRDGRVWSAASRELRQVPAGGEDRVLAERNRRDALVARGRAPRRRPSAAPGRGRGRAAPRSPRPTPRATRPTRAAREAAARPRRGRRGRAPRRAG